MQTKLRGSNPCGNADTKIRSYLLNIEDSVFHTAENNQSLLNIILFLTSNSGNFPLSHLIKSLSKE